MKEFRVCLLALFVFSFILLPMVAFADTVTLSGVLANDGSYIQGAGLINEKIN
jgi:hypothetical protein